MQATYTVSEVSVCSGYDTYDWFALLFERYIIYITERRYTAVDGFQTVPDMLTFYDPISKTDQR